VPYLCGVTRDNWMLAQQHISEETVVVDLDRNSVMFGQQTPELPPVPGKKWTKLRDGLQENVGHLFWKARGVEMVYKQFLQGKVEEDDFLDIAIEKGGPKWRGKLQTMDHAFDLQYTPENLQVDMVYNHQEQTQWDRVQEAFLRFFVALLKDYRRFLRIPDSSKLGSPALGSTDWIEWSNQHSFNQNKFIASQKGEYTSYLTELCSTQQFDDFITKRLYNPNQPDVIFFDQSIDAKMNRSRLKLRKTRTPFLQSAKAHKQLERFVAVKPNTIGLSRDAPFIYNSWPETFDTSLFGRPRPIPSIITAEFDRQASLAKQLRMTFTSGKNVATDLLELYGSDYDTNPEGMSFTVFFFTYCAVIGLEWQKYQRKQQENDCQTLFVEPSYYGGTEDWVRKEHKEVVQGDDAELPNERTYGLCDGNLCLNGKAVVDNAVVYITTNSPCQNLNSQAQAAYETLANLAACMDPLKAQRNTSLLDTDEAFAEYEEVRDVAVAQLDLAFDALRIMENRGLLSDPDVFKSIMEACGRCGDTKRALELIEIMKRDKLVTDNDVLVCFMAAFAQYGALREGGELPLNKHMITGHRASDAYSNFLRKKLLATKGANSEVNSLPPGLLSEEDGSVSEAVSESGSERSSQSGKSEKFSAPSFLQFVSPSYPSSKTTTKKKKRTRKKNGKGGVTDRVQKQLILGESLLEFLYPEICIDTRGDTCPMCSNVMNEDDVVSGWQPCEFQDLTSRCSQCGHRFVPRFKISTSSLTFTGSQGPGTPLYCEFLSPWVLRKELGHIIGDGDKVEQILDPEWRCGRDVRATIWWNLIVMLKRYNLPYTFLLQGSFMNRLINPGPQDV
jgi:pentatricopeptide repeat protein